MSEEDRDSALPPAQNTEGNELATPLPYYQAAWFLTFDQALQVYMHVQDTIAQAPCDLSAFRIELNHMPYVLVLGSKPAIALDEKLHELLSAGAEFVELPEDMLRILEARRAAARQFGPWVESHYRPGLPVSRHPKHRHKTPKRKPRHFRAMVQGRPQDLYGLGMAIAGDGEVSFTLL